MCRLLATISVLGLLSGCDPSSPTTKVAEGSGTNTAVPWSVAFDHEGPVFDLKTAGLQASLKNVSTFAAGDDIAASTSPWLCSRGMVCQSDSVLWIAIGVIAGDPVDVEVGNPTVLSGLLDESISVQLVVRRAYLEIEELWLGKPRTTKYAVYDISPSCPGKLIVGGKQLIGASSAGSCQYNDETGRLIGRVSGWGDTLPLENGSRWMVLGADAVPNVVRNGSWDTIRAYGGEPSGSIYSGSERFIYPIRSDGMIDLHYGPRGIAVDTTSAPECRWIDDCSEDCSSYTPQEVCDVPSSAVKDDLYLTRDAFAAILREQVIDPYIASNPGDATSIESVLYGPLQ